MGNMETMIIRGKSGSGKTLTVRNFYHIFVDKKNDVKLKEIVEADLLTKGQRTKLRNFNICHRHIIKVGGVDKTIMLWQHGDTQSHIIDAFKCLDEEQPDYLLCTCKYSNRTKGVYQVLIEQLNARKLTSYTCIDMSNPLEVLQKVQKIISDKSR